jgi:hypothetical protein
MEIDPDILAIREKFRLEKENRMKAEEAEMKPEIKYYYFGSPGKKSRVPMKLFMINGFMNWFEKTKKNDILDKILFENDIQNLIDEFNSS